MELRSPSRNSRGQSEVLGTALLIGLLFIGAAVVLAVGGPALGSIQQQVEIQQAEQSFTQLDSRAGQVALGGSSSQTVDLGLPGDGSLEKRQTGRIAVTYTDPSKGTTTKVFETTLGTVEYTQDGTTIAYQGGGVWRRDETGSVMISPPELHYRDGTLTLPIITVSGSGSLDDSVTVRNTGSVTQRFPAPATNSKFVNPVRGKKIKVTIRSDYYRAWGKYFEERTDGGVEYDHDDNEVTATLLKPDRRRVENAVAIGGGDSDQFQIQSGKNSVVDSYNSSTIDPDRGPNSPPSSTGDGDIVTDKNVFFDGNAQISGNLTTSGSVHFKSGKKGGVGGDLRYGTTLSFNNKNDDCNDYVDGKCIKDPSAATSPDPIDTEVANTISNLKSSNDNAGEPCFSKADAVEFSNCGSTVTLEAGDYYTNQDLQVGSGQKLLLDTSEGDIRIAVDEEKTVQILSGNVTVLGDGQVKVYGTKQYQVDGGKTKVWNRGWDAHQLWFFCTSDCQVQIKSSATFVGVMYAPSENGVQNAQVQIDGGQTDVYGAVVGGGQTQLQSNADVHFDDALRSESVFKQPTLPSISYLHITTNEVRFESD